MREKARPSLDREPRQREAVGASWMPAASGAACGVLLAAAHEGARFGRRHDVQVVGGVEVGRDQRERAERIAAEQPEVGVHGVARRVVRAAAAERGEHGERRRAGARHVHQPYQVSAA